MGVRRWPRRVAVRCVVGDVGIRPNPKRQPERESMRFGVIGPVGQDRFADNIAEALRHMGHHVAQLGPAYSTRANGRIQNADYIARMVIPAFDKKAQEKISEAAIAGGCEVVINVDQRLLPDTVIRIRNSGARIVFWYPDHVSNLGRELMILSGYDALFFKEPHIVDRLRLNLGLAAYYLPEACNPRWHCPLVAGGTDPYLVVAGNSYPIRVRLLEKLMAAGIPLKLYGAGMPDWLGDTGVRAVHCGYSIWREEKAHIFRAAAGVLNTMHPGEVSGVNVRLFEAAGCGAAVLTEYRPGVPDLFAIDDEVLAFRDFDELLEGARRLLDEKGLSARLGDAAARRAHRDHTYEHRIATILEKIS